MTPPIEITLDFLGAPKTYLYHVSLSGAAWAYRPVPGDASALPAGATTVNLAGVATTCNGHGVGDAGTVITVTAASIPATLTSRSAWRDCSASGSRRTSAVRTRA